MGPNKLKSAAEAAGYAMVNPEDFANDPRSHLVREAPTTEKSADQAKTAAPSRWWLSLEMFSFFGGKATA